MTRRIDRIRGAGATEERYGIDQWAQDAAFSSFLYAGNTYQLGLNQSWGPTKAESIGNDFEGYVRGAYRANGVVFSVMLARMLLFCEARFQWQDIKAGRPGKLFGNQDLAILETPWPNGTTGDLLARMEQHVSLAGNSYTVRRGNRLRQLRPDWVGIVFTGDPDGVDAEVAGYLYWPKGPHGGVDPISLLPEQVAHYAPIPDPMARYRGMSWLTPVLRDIQGDQLTTSHKLKFFEHAATPNVAVSLDKALTPEQFKAFVAQMSERHEGVENAYRTMWLGGGATPTVIGADLKQLDFKATQGAGEARIAAAGGVPPICAGLQEGLTNATYSNYGQAKRHFGDTFGRTHWRMAAGALQSILPVPAGARLWYDARDVAYLKEDEKSAAEVLSFDAQTTRQLVEAGFTAESVTAAVAARDLTLLQHTGLVSVQLQAPGSQGGNA